MATHSSEFLDVDEYEKKPSLHRSRSGGYADHLEEQVLWDRRDRERQMKRYHDSRFGSAASTQQRSTPDRLGVPVFESTRRNRSNSDIGRRQDDSTPKYNVQEVRPESKSIYDYNLSSEPALPSQLPVPHVWRPQHRKKPSINVEIHQDNPPKSTTPGQTPRRSPSASPRSPTAQPQLQYQYATLQNILSQVSTTCAAYLKVEAADPRDLTFTKIAEQVKGFSFDLQVWAHVVSLNSMAQIDARKRKVVEAASRNLDRLIDRVTELTAACSEAKPKDLKYRTLPEVDDENMFADDADDEESEMDPTESLGFVIHSSLHSIELQIQTLKRLSRSLQEATPDAKDELVRVSALVAEVAQYFGSQDALDRYAIDAKYAGGKALDEARYAAAH
ncbi:Nn.00g052700.m01.CDS01 [Neocucurbitaria sp. VM-36]